MKPTYREQFKLFMETQKQCDIYDVNFKELMEMMNGYLINKRIYKVPLGWLIDAKKINSFELLLGNLSCASFPSSLQDVVLGKAEFPIVWHRSTKLLLLTVRLLIVRKVIPDRQNHVSFISDIFCKPNGKSFNAKSLNTVQSVFYNKLKTKDGSLKETLIFEEHFIYDKISTFFPRSF